jgi:class 3 adenylate cyclase
MAPERRQLTVMFCDLVDSTSLADALDPEDLRDLVRNYQQRVGRIIAHYEGFIARYMGDGIVGYFGYPHAHEDDPARAVHAGLEIVEALEEINVPATRHRRTRLEVRVGIATGVVIVGDVIGEGTTQEADAVGATPNLAARLEAVAAPGTVVVSTRTRELAGGGFEFASLGARALKGFLEPVPVWQVLRKSAAESRFAAARERAQLTPFFGREAELERLSSLWRRACAGTGQVVVLRGEAGIGKSRAAEALDDRIAAEPHLRIRFQCSPYHVNSALHPFIDQLARGADFRRNDAAEEKLRKLQTLLASPRGGSTDALALLAALLSLPYSSPGLDPQQQKERTIAALADRLCGLSAQAPVYVLFEDAHWIDPTSSELLDRLVRMVAGLPMLLVFTSRSALQSEWAQLPHASVIDLERLNRHDAASMARRLLEGEGKPAAARLIDQIVDKTDGVPLFIEELAKTLTESDAPRDASVLRSEIPSSLQDSLMARLDRLGAAKDVAQTGAVIGREFSRELLAAVAPVDGEALDAALQTLMDSALVSRHGDAAPTFTFKHALVQDAAYESLLRGRRRETHQRIAATLENNYPELVRAEPEIVAHHYTHAGAAQLAARYWALAAQRALDRSANLEAVGHAGAGLELLASLPPNAERDRVELGLEILRGAAYRAVKGFASVDAERSFERARALSEQLGDAALLLDAHRGLFSCHYARGALAAARLHGDEVAAIGERIGVAGPRMLGLWMQGCVAFWQGEFATAQRQLEQAYALYDPNEPAKTLALQIDPGVNALFHLSWVQWILGYPDQAVATSEKAVATARRLAQPFALSMALFFSCATRACCGQRSEVAQLLRELVALADARKLGYLGSCARVLDAQELIADERSGEALQQIATAFAEFEAQGAQVGIPWAGSILATGHARLGQIDQGLAALTAATNLAGRNGEYQWAAELARLRGELLLLHAPPDETGAEAQFRAAIAIAQQQNAKSLELRATTSLARLLGHNGGAAEARRMLVTVYDWFTEGAETADLRAARNTLESLEKLPIGG